HERARLLRLRLGERALPGAHPSSPIVAVLVGDPVRTMELDRALWERGYLVQGLRPPTVEPGTSRLRLGAGAARHGLPGGQEGGDGRPAGNRRRGRGPAGSGDGRRGVRGGARHLLTAPRSPRRGGRGGPGAGRRGSGPIDRGG